MLLTTCADIMNFQQSNHDCNKIVCNPDKITLNNSKIQFNGKNNRLFLEDGIKLVNSRIVFAYSNSIAYLSGSYKLDVTLCNTCQFYIGKSFSINNTQFTAHISEHTKLIIGDYCLFSHNISIRSADAHLIYDVNPPTTEVACFHLFNRQTSFPLYGLNSETSGLRRKLRIETN